MPDFFNAHYANRWQCKLVEGELALPPTDCGFTRPTGVQIRNRFQNENVISSQQALIGLSGKI